MVLLVSEAGVAGVWVRLIVRAGAAGNGGGCCGTRGAPASRPPPPPPETPPCPPPPLSAQITELLARHNEPINTLMRETFWATDRSHSKSLDRPQFCKFVSHVCAQLGIEVPPTKENKRVFEELTHPDHYEAKGRVTYSQAKAEVVCAASAAVPRSAPRGRAGVEAARG